MKQTPDDERVAARLAPGVLAQGGFLGSDRRTLAEILREDAAEAERLGLAPAVAAGRLRAIVEAAQAALGTPVALPGGLTAVAREAMGRIPCPWGHGRLFPKGDVEVAAPEKGLALRLSPLSVHLVEAHGFYGGRGSRYRLEPADLARLFGPAETR